MKHYYCLSFVFLFVVFFHLQVCAQEEAPVTADSIVAIVNDEIVTLHELNVMLAPLYFQLRDTAKSSYEMNTKMAEERAKLLKQLIEAKLLIQEAEKEGITVQKSEIDEYISDIKQKFESESAFKAALKEQDLRESDLRKRYKEQLMVNKLVDKKVRGAIYIGPSEIYRYYEDHKDDFKYKEKFHLYNILIRVKDPKKSKEAKDKAKTILNRLKAGVDFKVLAKSFSEGPNAEKSGDMGIVQRGDLIKELDEIVFQLEKGQVAGPILSSIGYHIIKLVDKEEARNLSLAEAKDKIHVILYRKTADEKYIKYLKRLKDNAYISIR